MPDIIYMPPSDDDAELRRLAGSFIATYRNANTRDGYSREIRRWFTWCQVRGVDPVNAKRTEVEVVTRPLDGLNLAWLASVPAHVVLLFSSQRARSSASRTA